MPSSKSSTQDLYLVRCTIQGEEISRARVEADKENFNIYKFDAGQLAYSAGQLAMTLTRTMTISPDGLNHQASYSAIFDAKSLKMIKKIGQTTSHSFGLTVMAD